jgi:hypothetical protein
LKVRVFIAFIAFGLTVGADSPALPPETIVAHYCDATRGQSQLMQASSMDVEIAASLPKLKKQGKLHALRRVSALGRITYEKLRFEGDGTVKKQVINRYLSAEAEAQQNPSLSIALTPDNYNFKYKGKTQLEGRETHLFDVSPKHKRQGLFQGQVWIDAVTYLRVQESGYLVKSPSILLKKIAFVRKFEIRGGLSVPRQEQSVVDTRLGIGRAEMTIEFSNFSLDNSRGAVNGAPDLQ